MKRLLQHMISILLLYTWSMRSTTSSSPEIAKKNCRSVCGCVNIPYPFGIGPHYYFNEWFEIECNLSVAAVAKPFLRRLQLEVLSISVEDNTLLVPSPITYFNCKGKQSRPAANLTGTPFSYSFLQNRFVAASCGFLVSIVSGPNHTAVTGCTSVCVPDDSFGYYCDIGVNCCSTGIPPYISSLALSENNKMKQEKMGRMARIMHSWLIENGLKKNQIASSDYGFLLNNSSIKSTDVVPVQLGWSLNLSKNKALIKSFEAHTRSSDKSSSLDDSTPARIGLSDPVDQWYDSYTCWCPAGFEGNHYFLRPCQDIDECKDNNPCVNSDLNTTGMWNIRNAKCKNTIGGHTCCSNRTRQTCELFAGSSAARCFHKIRNHSQLKPILSGLGVGIGLLLFLSGAWWVYTVAKKWQNIKHKEQFYKKNGGLLLEQQLSSTEINVERIKLFNSRELESSTDNFNVDRIIGQGGQGTVYKGMLTDGRIVAVKKSEIEDKANLSEFINEVVILSQINHINIVQLLGRCLETEVHLLVYEFIPNGNLYQYIHEHTEEFPLTWEIRLRIATEIAGALSYLHTLTSSPIYHRDIKSMNILLDEKNRAKISYFGTSRLVAIDQTHVTTIVHGTFGYLDPEYYQSSQFTEKSDVYSFGVVLVELLTGKKPVTRSDEDEMYKSLVTHFLVSMQEGCTYSISLMLE